MSACTDIDAMMIDWLYDELDESMSAQFDQHLADCARCRRELESLQHTREAVRELPELEPPAGLTAILLHEAAKRAPAKRAVALASEDERPGFFAWLAGWLAPVTRHPAAAAIATLVLVAGVAGSLYLREVKVTQPRLTSPEESTPVAVATAERSVDEPPATVAIPPAHEAARNNEDGYAVQLADQGDVDLLAKESSSGRAAAASPTPTVTDKAYKDADRAENVQLAAKLEQKPAPAKNMRNRKLDLALDDNLANAVSGADELVDREEATRYGTVTRDLRGEGEAPGGIGAAGGSTSNATKLRGAGQPQPVAGPTGSKAGKKKVASRSPASQTTYADPRKQSTAQPNAPAPEPAQQAYSSYRDPKRELEWAQTEHRKLAEALRGKRCRDAARIANDILDRNPGYYAQYVERSKDLKQCQWYVDDERGKRSRQRSKARPKKAAPARPAETDAYE